MSKKHDVLKEICAKLGITPDPSWFSTGSTITRNSLDAILSKVGSIDKDFDLVTKPIPVELRMVFVKFLRGFEDYYRILKAEEVTIKTEILENGCIGINILPIDKTQVREEKVSYFEQWLKFAVTGEPKYIDSFDKLDRNQRALIIVIRRQQFDNLLQSQLLKASSGNLNRAMNTSGLLPPNVTVNNYIDVSPTISVEAYAKTDVDISINLADQIAKALDDNDKSALEEYLSKVVEEEKKSPGFLKNILFKAKGPAGKIILKLLGTWLSNPENVKDWSPELIKLIEVALLQ
jgi:hypothetical protein